VSRLVDEANEDNKLEVGMICDGYLMRIDNLSPALVRVRIRRFNSTALAPTIIRRINDA
jgi:hypothetical protein